MPIRKPKGPSYRLHRPSGQVVVTLNRRDSYLRPYNAPASRGEKKGDDDEALGRSRGGFSTKLHIAVEAAGRPVELILSPGQAQDMTQASRLLAGHDPHDRIADQGVDRAEFIAEIRT